MKEDSLHRKTSLSSRSSLRGLGDNSSSGRIKKKDNYARPVHSPYVHYKEIMTSRS